MRAVLAGIVAVPAIVAAAHCSHAVGEDEAMRLDMAPFAVVTTDGTTTTLRWEEPRDIERVVVTLDGPAPKGAAAVEYWQHQWPANRVTDADLQKGAGGSLGWKARDDWFNGQWKPAKTVARRSGSQLTLTFAPLGDTEFPDLAKDYDVPFRQANQLRVVIPAGSPRVAKMEVLQRHAA